jgi:hypothetical protein
LRAVRITGLIDPEKHLTERASERRHTTLQIIGKGKP